MHTLSRDRVSIAVAQGVNAHIHPHRAPVDTFTPSLEKKQQTTQHFKTKENIINRARIF
jgi:hypothetical protein